MLRNKMLLTCLAAVILLTGGLALAKPIKLDLVPTGIEPGASGKAIVKYASKADVTQIHVNCHGLTPGREYTVLICLDFCSIKAGTFTAGNGGTGNCRASIEGDVSGYPVAIGDPYGFQKVLTGQEAQ